MARIDEHTLNTRLAERLRRRSPAWRESDQITAEGLRALEGLGRPDILVRSSDGPPVVIETEFSPARTVEQDALARLGLQTQGAGAAIEHAVAVRAPASLRDTEDWELADQVEDARWEYAVFSTPEGPETGAPLRFPGAEWLQGSVDDLAGLIEGLAVSERAISESTDVLERGVRWAATRLREGCHDRPEVLGRIADLLFQPAGVQTDRMAAAIIVNACTFHAAIAGKHGIRELSELRVAHAQPRDRLLREWERILQINYWPIFRIAHEILRMTPSAVAAWVLQVAVATADDLTGLGATSSHDLTGRMFQRLITDRKFLATFYTKPEVATLLADLAVGMTNTAWSDPDGTASLRVADLACGTGTLLSAAYSVIIGKRRRAGHDDAADHPVMMGKCLIAADIMPAATHLTASMLSSIHPAVTYGGTQIYTLPYGPTPSTPNPVLGSLSLLEHERMPSLFGGGLATEIEGLGSKGAETVTEAELQSESFALADESLDLVIMNPPFTRPTNHESTAENVPSFAGFGQGEAEQKAMSAELGRLRALVGRRRREQTPRGAPPASHGNAGLASNFLDLAHAKLRPGGTLALVMPGSLALGDSWKGGRNLLARHYERLMFISIAAAASADRSFSADTGMAEILVLGRRRKGASLGPGSGEASATWISLRKRPGNAAEATETARGIRETLACAGTQYGDAFAVRLGGDAAASGIRASVADGGCAGVADLSLIEVALGLGRGKLPLLHARKSAALPITRLGDLGSRGPLDRDVGGRLGAAMQARGPFKIVPPLGVPTYPVLWGHKTARERRLTVEPDSMGEIRRGRDDDAASIWMTASRLHFNRDFQTNSQSLAACLTPERTIGGRAWPSFQPHKTVWEEALVAWANTTLGLLLFWWAGSKQQAGRTVFTVGRLPDLLALDLRALDPDAIGRLRDAFRAMQDKGLLEAHRAAEDPARQELDRRVLGDALGFDDATLEEVRLIGRKWCAEPSVHGGKRPQAPPTETGSPGG